MADSNFSSVMSISELLLSKSVGLSNCIRKRTILKVFYVLGESSHKMYQTRITQEGIII